MKLPEAFLQRMKAMLGDEFEAFIASYDAPHHVSLKVNTLKIDVATFVNKFPYPLRPVPWNPEGFYYDVNDPVSKHPYFHAGLYYIQEPSAMTPVMGLSPVSGDCCLDLCAAPGGKSMQIATAIGDTGLLVSNDINETRVKAILRNAERFGLRNMIILNESPEAIAKAMPHVFDRVLVDAPCSGEGMFRKDPKAVASWEKFGPSECAIMQRDIIKQLPNLVKEQTTVVYSTCTFSQEENEQQMAYLLSTNEGFLPGILSISGVESDTTNESINTHMMHLWPHIHEGEGHFIGKLMAHAASSNTLVLKEPNRPPELVEMFMNQHMPMPLKGHFEIEGERVFLRPEKTLSTKGLHVVREGLLVGEIKKGRFTPSQALALYLKAENFNPKLDLTSDSVDVLKYLKGETLFTNVETEGLHLVCTDGYPLGFAKISKGTLKNLYPVSWRML